MSSSDAELKVTFHFVLFAWEDGPPPSTLTWLKLCGTDEKLASTFSPNVWKKANKNMFQNGKTTQRKPRESCTEGWEFVWVWWLSGELINNACSSGWKSCSVHGLINHTLRIRFCSFNSLCSWKHKVIDTNAECAPSYVFHKRDKWTDLDQTLPFCKCSLPNSTAAWANISRHCWSQNLLNYLNTMYCHLFRLRLTGPSIIS